MQKFSKVRSMCVSSANNYDHKQWHGQDRQAHWLSLTGSHTIHWPLGTVRFHCMHHWNRKRRKHHHRHYSAGRGMCSVDSYYWRGRFLQGCCFDTQVTKQTSECSLCWSSESFYLRWMWLVPAHSYTSVIIAHIYCYSFTSHTPNLV